MSARPPLFVCAALLAALLAPPAAAKPAESPKRETAHKTAKTPSTPARATSPTAKTGEVAQKPVPKDTATKTGASGASSKERRADVIDGRRLVRSRPDVIDGRDAAAVRALYRKQNAQAAGKGAKSGSSRPEARRADAPSSGRAPVRGAAADPGRASAGSQARAELTRDAARSDERAGALADVRQDMSYEAGLNAQVAPDMAKKSGAKKPRGAADDGAGEALAASGERPTSACAAWLGATPAVQFDRTRATLREFSWADMAYFFETAPDEAEPEPRQVGHEGTLPVEEALRRSGLPRKALDGLAHARAVDLLTERELTRVDKALATASPTAIAALLQADSPSLRAHVWTWLATTPTGVCALAKLDGRLVDAAIRDRSVAVEHGEDLVFRPLGDYALAARARLAAADPAAFDALLRSLWSEPGIDPRVRALVAGLRVRRGHGDSVESGLRDPVASVRGATAAAAPAPASRAACSTTRPTTPPTW
jgi:hypothetical protein